MGLSGLYYIVNVKAKTVVDLYSPPGIDINGWQSTWDLPGKNQNQIWTITEVSDGHVVITNCWTGTYLSAPKTLEQSTNPPTTIEARSLATASKPTDNYVRWIPKEQNGGSYVFESVAYPAKIFDLTGGETANETPIIVWSKGIGDNQRWTLRPTTL